MASDTGAPLTFPDCTNSDRGSLKQSNPLLLRGLEKGKPQSESLFFSGNLRSHEGATVRKTRIITELGMPVQDAFDALLIMNLGRLPSWVVLRGLSSLSLLSPLRGVMDGVLQLRDSGSGTRPNGSRAARD